MNNITFENLGLEKSITERLEKISIKEPTAVQQKIIPMVLDNKNIMFQSETGTGKTFAYALPLIQNLEKELNGKQTDDFVRILIAAPTYELASQIKVQIQKVTDIKCALCIGGAPISRQIEMLKEKPVIVIGGSARLLELIHLKKLKADKIQTLVLDEADRLLSPELRDETEGLMERLPKKVELIGCSATVSKYTTKILTKARKVQENKDDNHGENFQEIEFVELPAEDVLRKRITHWALFAEKRQKIDTLRSFIHAVKPEKLIVFTAKTDQVDNITSKLKYKNIECQGLCGKTDKKLRKEIIDKFRSGKIPVLITTDLASRGLDIQGVTHVVQMDLPESTDFFVHRSGRTGRAGHKGFNCVIGDEYELQNYAKLEKKLKITVYPKILYQGKLQDPN